MGECGDKIGCAYSAVHVRSIEPEVMFEPLLHKELKNKRFRMGRTLRRETEREAKLGQAVKWGWFLSHEEGGEGE